MSILRLVVFLCVLTAVTTAMHVYVYRRAVRDVTDHRRAEQRLIESEARNAAIVGAALDCIITFDRRGKVVEFNPAAERTFQCTRARALGLDLVSFIIPPARREEVFQPFQRLGDGTVGGTGLGLAVALGLTNVLNGWLEILDTPGGGTTFALTLDAAPKVS